MTSDFQPLNQYFDQIIVITLERAGERRQRLQERLQGLNYRFHFGVDWRELDTARLAREGYDDHLARQVSRFDRPMSLGQIACAISHRQIHELVVRNEWRRALIFEDDVVPLDGVTKLPAALAQLPAEWELVYFGYTNFERVTIRNRGTRAAYLVLSTLRLMKWKPGEVLRFHPQSYSSNLRRAGLHHGAHAYGLSAAGAKKLLANQQPLAHIADQLFIHLVLKGELNAFVMEPKAFEQDQAAAFDPVPSFVNEQPAH